MSNTIDTATFRNVSQLADTLIGSEILKLSAEINAKIAAGEKIYNLTVGDFNPKFFKIPAELKQEIIEAYIQDETNYPPATGIAPLINEVSNFTKKRLGIDYASDEILIAGGSRPLIYAIFKAIIDSEDTVIYPVPSWNNNHYCHLSGCNQIVIETNAEHNFMPTANDIKPHLPSAQLLTLCSPLNPTGTTFSEKELRNICELVLEENKRREGVEKPLYVMYDQVYWTITFDGIEHVNPVSLYPEMKKYTIFVDGISKAYAATGVRVGWSFGPKLIIDKMKSILGHVGAWAPKAEQIATSKYLQQDEKIISYSESFQKEIYSRLSILYNGIKTLKSEGFPIDAVAPQGAMYLTVQFNLKGKKKENGEVIINTPETTQFLLEEAKIGIVPFTAFGASENSNWYRISVGTIQVEDTYLIIENIKKALEKLN